MTRLGQGIVSKEAAFGNDAKPRAWGMRTEPNTAGASVKTFRDLEIWQEGVSLAEQIYRLTTSFPKDETYGLTGQMRRAAVSVPANIAEGHARHYRTEYRQFLYMALGSIAELETLGTITRRVGLLTSEQAREQMELLLASIRNKTLALIRRL